MKKIKVRDRDNVLGIIRYLNSVQSQRFRLDRNDTRNFQLGHTWCPYCKYWSIDPDHFTTYHLK